MRDAPHIQDLWALGGPFTGADGKPHTRVTIQLPWDTADPAVEDGDEDHVIHPTHLKAGSRRSRGIPVRWYQKADNSQTEEEIPNIKVVTIDRSIDTDAATCTITLYNQWMYNNGEVPPEVITLGNKHLAGFFSPGRGSYPEAQARWGQETNDWTDRLVPNSLLRTYQGYGGHSKSLQECLDDGNLILTGVWLIDEVRVSTNGELEITCRDMAKLLIEQQLFKGLVPVSRYPLTYYRWVIDNFRVAAGARTQTLTQTVNITAGNKRCKFLRSEVDMWYPGQESLGGYLLHGHRGKDSIDGNTDTFYLGVGNSGPDRDFAVDWIEYECGEYMNAVYVHPWAGNYTMYVSVMENGKWQGNDTVPYDPSELYGSQPVVVDTGADIKYVAKFGVPWEQGRDYVLPRVYKAERVRISFRHLAYSQWGPWHYRAGVREFKIKATSAVAGQYNYTTTEVADPIFFAADAHPTSGYLTGSQFWQMDAFGDARKQRPDAGAATGDYLTALRFTPTGLGYWGLDLKGRILAFGDAVHYGDPYTDDGFRWVPDDDGALDMAVTSTGLGYWVITSRSGVYAYGDATVYAEPTMTGESGLVSIESHPTGDGWWVLDGNGKVTARGDCTDFGDFSEASLNFNRLSEDFDQQAVRIRSTSTGDGYWILTNSGRVQEFGDANDYGQADTPVPTDELTFLSNYVQIMPGPDDLGYLLMRGNGYISWHGDVDWYGSPIPGTQGQIRKPGNYTDYADIIKDLALWSGFLLYDQTISSTEEPAVYGNIETTGSWSDEQLPDEIFDKRPVIDAMTELKEAVGYILFVDDEGGIRFESPNWWAPGNFIQSTGERSDYIPEIDEAVNLIQYGASRNDDSLRSLIIISSEDPNEAGTSTVTTKIVPQTADGLKGLLKPAMWVNGFFQNEDEQRVMAELIALHIWFAQRLGQVTCAANPAIQINDQVRIFERVTSEVFLHYVRGINTVHDLDSGEYTMTLTTHWLGTGDEWVVTDSPDALDDPARYVVSEEVLALLRRGQYTVSHDNPMILGDTTSDPTFTAQDPNGPTGPPASPGEEGSGTGGSSTEDFVIGVTMPDATNTGLVDVTTTTYTTTQTFSTNDQLIENVRFECFVNVTGKRIRFYNCEFVGPASYSLIDRGLVNCSNSNCEDIEFERCKFRPQTPQYGIDGIFGHHFTAHRCDFSRSEDGLGVAWTSAGANSLATVITGNYIHDMLYKCPNLFQSDNRSHCDGIQIHYPNGVTVTGNNIQGFIDTAISDYSSPTYSGSTQISGYQYYDIGSEVALSCILIGAVGSYFKDILINMNWMDGSAFSFVNVHGSWSTATNFRVLDNRWGREHAAVNDEWTVSAASTVPITITGNTYLDDGSAYNGRKNA